MKVFYLKTLEPVGLGPQNDIPFFNLSEQWTCRAIVLYSLAAPVVMLYSGSCYYRVSQWLLSSSKEAFIAYYLVLEHTAGAFRICSWTCGVPFSMVSMRSISNVKIESTPSEATFWYELMSPCGPFAMWKLNQYHQKPLQFWDFIT